jgi:phage gpG-like protein
MAEFTINDKEAQEFIKKAIKKVDQIKQGERSFASAVSAIVFSDIMGHFKQQQGSLGPWKPWSKIYASHMDKIGKGGNQILQDTGRLRQSFLPTNYRTTSEGILWFNPARTKSGFPYAAAHDEGGPKLPKRDFMWISDDAKDRIEDVTLKFLEEDL